MQQSGVGQAAQVGVVQQAIFASENIKELAREERAELELAREQLERLEFLRMLDYNNLSPKQAFDILWEYKNSQDSL
jgi:hypothetical protein